MFNSGIKGNQRCNGIYNTPHDVSGIGKTANSSRHYNNATHKVANKIDNKDVYSSNKKHVEHQLNRSTNYIFNNGKSFNGSSTGSQMTKPANIQDFDRKIDMHSIIVSGFNDINTRKKNLAVEQKVYKEIAKVKEHEPLQRIECETDELNYYQHHWFSPSLEKCKLEDRSREERIEITRHEFLRRWQQLKRSCVGVPNKMPDWIERRKSKVLTKKNKSSTITSSAAPKLCEVNECGKPALVCAKYCVNHIMYDSRQILFEYCTAKFADNTQCSVPVFDISHELPLCGEHARKRDNYRLYQEAKPKKMRKKVKPSAMIRPQKRNKKKKKLPVNKQSSEIANNTSAIIREVTIPSNGLIADLAASHSSVLEEDLQMVDQVLALNENGLEQALVSQTHLLEETDITTVLNTIQPDEFADIFTVNRNGEYEPNREEAEELEKALAAVDNDVKSLEKLSQSHGLLDSFLDEHVLTDSLVQIPDMLFHNGYAACGDNIVTQSSSYLLPVEPHSHS